ncbi:MAG: N-acetylmuramoyl-L-alanine amidase [Bacteroidales bacterium]|nr:N-acetylmuramoyl-L-alanine amidase [Bacteroidales bacterium]
MRTITKIIVHCSATPAGRDVKMETIRCWHVDLNGWKDIGYHYVVELDGTVREGRPEAETGAHCKGQNTCSIGVCYVGGCSVDGKRNIDTRTDAQKAALLELLRKLRAKYPAATIHGHNEYAAKDCPCFNAAKEYADL